MKNPKINRFIGYVILAVGLAVSVVGFKDSNMIIAAVGILILIASVLWMILKVRCPHCGALLHLKLWNIDVCPNCGKNTDDIDN